RFPAPSCVGNSDAYSPRPLLIRAKGEGAVGVLDPTVPHRAWSCPRPSCRPTPARGALECGHPKPSPPGPGLRRGFLRPHAFTAVTGYREAPESGSWAGVPILVPWFLALPEFWFRKAFPRCFGPSSHPGRRQC
ncbi:hypothetical protein MC885_019199, partial [Smutsia gigantea]